MKHISFKTKIWYVILLALLTQSPLEANTTFATQINVD